VSTNRMYVSAKKNWSVCRGQNIYSVQGVSVASARVKITTDNY